MLLPVPAQLTVPTARQPLTQTRPFLDPHHQISLFQDAHTTAFLPETVTIHDDIGNTKNSWSDVVKKGSRRRSKRLSTAGTAPDGILQGVVVPENVPKAVFHLRNLSATCTKEQVIKHLSDNDIIVTNVSLFPQETQPSIANARVTVYKAHAAKMHSAALWPNGVIVRDWKFMSHKPTADPSKDIDAHRTSNGDPPSSDIANGRANGSK